MPSPPLLPLDTALERLLAMLTPLPQQDAVPLADARGQVLAASAIAAVAVPPFANSAMDGYAVRSADAHYSEFRISQRIMAGDAPGAPLTAGCCARLFTGAPLPAGADCVIAQEDAITLGASQVRFTEAPVAGKHVRPAGQDVAAGEVIGRPGDLVDSSRLALLAASGIPTVTAHRLPRVAILTTGNELKPAGTPLAAGEIYNSNGLMLAALLDELGLPAPAPMHVRDDRAALRTALDEAATQADAILCSGGVSVGEADLVREIMVEEGAMHFWRLALKPGRPFAFGHYRQRPVFGLPGNPVSSWLTFQLLVRPALLRLAGVRNLAPAGIRARLASSARKHPGRREFQRGMLHPAEQAQLPTVQPWREQGSNLISSLVNGNCLIDLPAAADHPEAGTEVDVIMLHDLRRGLG